MILMYCYGSSFHASRLRIVATTRQPSSTATIIPIAQITTTAATPSLSTSEKVIKGQNLNSMRSVHSEQYPLYTLTYNCFRVLFFRKYFIKKWIYASVRDVTSLMKKR